MHIVVTLPRSYDCAVTFFEDKEIALEYYTQVSASDPILAQVLDVKPAADEARAYLESCKGLARYASVEKVVEAFEINPRNAKAVLGWNGSMANKFLRLAGVWDGLDQAEKNVILGYEVQQRGGQ